MQVREKKGEEKHEEIMEIEKTAKDEISSKIKVHTTYPSRMWMDKEKSEKVWKATVQKMKIKPRMKAWVISHAWVQWKQLLKAKHVICISNADMYNAEWVQALEQVAEGKSEEHWSEKCECQNVKGKRVDVHIWERVTDQPSIEGWVMENRPVKTILKVVRDEVDRVGLGDEMGDQWEKEIAQSLCRVYQKSEYEGWTWDKVKAWKKENLSEEVWATKVDKGKGKIMKACKWKYMRRVIREVMGEKGAVVGVAHKKKT